MTRVERLVSSCSLSLLLVSIFNISFESLFFDFWGVIARVSLLVAKAIVPVFGDMMLSKFKFLTFIDCFSTTTYVSSCVYSSVASTSSLWEKEYSIFYVFILFTTTVEDSYAIGEGVFGTSMICPLFRDFTSLRSLTFKWLCWATTFFNSLIFLILVSICSLQHKQFLTGFLLLSYFKSISSKSVLRPILIDPLFGLS